jgi:hypothetical protein
MRLGLPEKRSVLSLRWAETPIQASRRRFAQTPLCFASGAPRDFEVANVPRYPAGEGSAAIFGSMPANSRRVRWLSASSNQ